MSVGKNLKRLRNKTKYSQQDVADYLGVDRNTYANWEAETSDIKSDYIPKLADFYKVEIQDLFDKSSSKIIIKQKNSDNKENSTNNSVVVILSDKEAVEEIVKLVEKRIS